MYVSTYNSAALSISLCLFVRVCVYVSVCTFLETTLEFPFARVCPDRASASCVLQVDCGASFLVIGESNSA